MSSLRLLPWSASQRSLPGAALHLAGSPFRAAGTAAGHAERLLERSTDLVESMEHFAETTRRQSIGSVLSFRSVYSVGSWFSAASAFSLGSAGSFGSIGSAGSILSIGSAGSILSIGSAGSVLAIGGIGRFGPRRLAPAGGDTSSPETDDPDVVEPGATVDVTPATTLVRKSATLLAVAALAGAVTQR